MDAFNTYNNTVGPGSIWNGMKSIGNMFNPGPNPYENAEQYFNKIPGTMKPYFEPYINAGRDAMGKTQGQYDQLMNDPSAMYNKFAKGYTQSPGYQWNLNQGMNAATNAAAAGGMVGTPEHQQRSAGIAEGLA